VLLTKCSCLIVCDLSLRLQVCVAVRGNGAPSRGKQWHEPVLLPTSTMTVLGCVKFLASASQVAK
jgi:hypothetical protein